MTPDRARRVLVVDDDPDIRATLADLLADEGCNVFLAASAEEALVLLPETEPEVVLSDIRMAGLTGLDLLRKVRESTAAPDVVLMTAFDDMATVAAAMQEGASDFLSKPLDLHQLRTVLERVFADQHARARARPDASEEDATDDQIVGRDPRMITIYKLVGQVASRATTVLIRGESGTGKELIARAIHARSAAAAQPFVPVNCAALPTGLLESELFGHVRGSFTGATSDRRGRFALAGKGTLFLDEIGDTTLEFQAKLLRVLESREFFPVGAERAHRTEARVIAATHRQLEQLIEEKLFRGDLYYRLRVVEITIPPLRERPADIPLLAEHLVRRTSHRLGLEAPPLLAEEAIQALVARPWPGNVRELENCLTRAVVLATGGVIRPEILAPEGEQARSNGKLDTLADAEREHLLRVLAACSGNKARSARTLGISRPRLDRLLWKHGLSGGREPA